MHEDIADIVGMQFANEVERVDAELAKEKKTTDARNAANGKYHSRATYHADIERYMARTERLSTFLMNTWVELIRRKQGTFTKEDVSFVYGEVCHFMAGAPSIHAPLGTPVGTAQAMREELTRQTMRLQSSINRSLQVVHREEALPQRTPENVATSRVGNGNTHLAKAQIPTSGSPEMQVPEPSASVNAKRPTTGRKAWSLDAKIALWSTVALVVVGLATPEIRRWLGLERPEVVHAPNAVSSSAPGTKGQENVHNEPAKPPSESIQQNEPGAKKKAQDSSRSVPTPPLPTPSTTTEKHKTTDSVSAVVNPAPDTVSVSVNRAGAKSQTLVDSKDKMNWRKHLRVGMTADEVRSLFGEPDRIYDSGAWQIWDYGKGSITLDDGKIHGWREPD